MDDTIAMLKYWGRIIVTPLSPAGGKKKTFLKIKKKFFYTAFISVFSVQAKGKGNSWSDASEQEKSFKFDLLISFQRYIRYAILQSLLAFINTLTLKVEKKISFNFHNF